jgi:hypothetical protein
MTNFASSSASNSVGLNYPATAPQVVLLQGHAQGTVSLTTTAAQSSALEEGLYDLWTSADCYIKVATTANDVTTGNGYLLRSSVTLPSVLIRTGDKIGGIVASGTGTLSYHKVG